MKFTHKILSAAAAVAFVAATGFGLAPAAKPMTTKSKSGLFSASPDRSNH